MGTAVVLKMASRAVAAENVLRDFTCTLEQSWCGAATRFAAICYTDEFQKSICPANLLFQGSGFVWNSTVDSLIFVSDSKEVRFG